MHSEPTRRDFLAGLGAAGAATVLALSGVAAAARDVNRGVNIPLWFDQDDGSSLPPSSEVLEFLRANGFAAIRLPLSPARYAAGDLGELQQLSSTLRDLHDRGFSVTLDMHPLGDFRAALEAGSEAETVIAAAWSSLAGLACDSDPQLTSLELLNEPPMWQDRWLPLRDRLASIVRHRTQLHPIIWGANRYQRIDETLQCPPLADANARVAVHYYSPMVFTHQCQNWGDAPQIAGHVGFPAHSWGVADIDNDFALLAVWAQANNTVVLLNEFGTLGFCSDLASRATWTKTVRLAAERHGMGWSYWELDRGFGFLQARDGIAQADQTLLDALVGNPV